jgi:hypothetical protein
MHTDAVTPQGTELVQVIDQDGKWWLVLSPPSLSSSLLEHPLLATHLRGKWKIGVFRPRVLTTGLYRSWGAKAVARVGSFFKFSPAIIYTLFFPPQGTLLNLLFGTHFEVMDAELGRTQTTKGRPTLHTNHELIRGRGLVGEICYGWR